MNRIKIKAVITSVLLITSSWIFAGTQNSKYNVLFIAVDDLRPELGCYGNAMVKSPNIDKIAKEGIVFENAFCQQAVCGPSRASFLSGMRPNSNKVTSNKTVLSQMVPNLLSIPAFYKQAGYEVTSLGKIYHHRGEGGDDPESWSKPEWEESGEWVGRGYLSKEAIAQVDFKELDGKGPSYEAAEVSDEAYADGKLANEAINRLIQYKETGKPFFMACGFHKPHLPFCAPKKYWDMYNPDELYKTEQTNWPEGMPGYAKGTYSELRSYVDIEKKSTRVPDKKAKALIHGYYACVSYVDAQIGRVLDELERLDLKDNTIVVLFGDHGWKLNDYGSWCKHTNFEIDTHVPLIVSAPGTKKGKRSQALVELVDLYPTLVDLCKMEVPEHCDGTSMVPLLKRPKRRWKEAAFSQFPRKNLMGHTLRSGEWRYTEWIDKDGKIVDRELYDHSKGPLADMNLANEDRYKSIISELSQVLDKGEGWRKLKDQK